MKDDVTKPDFATEAPREAAPTSVPRPAETAPLLWQKVNGLAPRSSITMAVEPKVSLPFASSASTEEGRQRG